MGRLIHIYEPGLTYLITTVTRRREKFFGETELAQAVHTDITFYAKKFSIDSAAHVIMLDHLHWVMHPSSEDFERFKREEQSKGAKSKYAAEPERFYLSKVMEDYKRHVAHVVNTHHAAHGRQVWQEGFRDDALRTPQAIDAAVRYVIMNPVKAGLVQEPDDYPFLAWAPDWLK